MRKIYYCTIHDLWEKHSIVQSMIHGECVPYVPPHNPWSTDKNQLYSCTIHHPWTIYFPSTMGCTVVLTSMGHWLYNALYNNCMAHDPWAFCQIATPMTHGEKVAEPCVECTSKRVIHSRCTQHVSPVHNAGTLQEHLSTTIQLLLAITLQAHVDVTFQMWQKCYWWSHCRQMLRLHFKCEWNVSGWNIGRTLWQSLKCSQHVNTCFHRPSPPVGEISPNASLIGQRVSVRCPRALPLFPSRKSPSLLFFPIASPGEYHPRLPP